VIGAAGLVSCATGEKQLGYTIFREVVFEELGLSFSESQRAVLDKFDREVAARVVYHRKEAVVQADIAFTASKERREKRKREVCLSFRLVGCFSR
jgi:hypothetical protein